MSEAAADPLAELEQRVLDEAVRLAPRLGWSGRMAAEAAKAAGLDAGEAGLLLPNGPRDLAALLSRRHDARAMGALCAVDPAALKIRERIAAATEARIEAAVADEAAVRRWAGFLSLPPNAPLAVRLVWETADGIWRWAGDTATDENHYTKRAILSGILVSTLAVRLSESPGAARRFLDRRIENVMAYERLKRRFAPGDAARELVAALARVRYGAR